METHVIYSAGVGSMDSWDMENLKYLRRLSRSNQATLAGTDLSLGTESYSSQNSEALGSDEEFLHLDQATSIASDYSAQTVVPVSSQDSNGVVLAPLDSCYVLDIVTVRNESVLANRISSLPNNANAKSLSDGYESSADSSLDERNFFEGDDGNPETYSDLGEFKGTSQSTIVQREQSPHGRRSSSACPYCDHDPTTPSNGGQSSPFFYLGQSPMTQVEETSLVPTLGDDGPPEMPRSPSPYYVRLRRDLYNLPSSYSPVLRSPSNFGMDQQGQLLIDYSPNWTGLANYIQNLKL